MKHRIAALLLAGAFLLTAASSALAHDYDSGDSGHPLRYAAYIAHPFGVALEYGVTRPIHWLVSRPHLCAIFGHDPRPNDVYFEWNGCARKEKKCGAAEKPAECEKREACAEAALAVEKCPEIASADAAETTK